MPALKRSLVKYSRDAAEVAVNAYLTQSAFKTLPALKRFLVKYFRDATEVEVNAYITLPALICR